MFPINKIYMDKMSGIIDRTSTSIRNGKQVMMPVFILVSIIDMIAGNIGHSR